MERPSDASGRRVSRQRALAGLILLPGLLVAGLTVRDAILLRALQGRIIEQRASLYGLASEVRKVKARRDPVNAATNFVSMRRRPPEVTPGWERVLALLPPEATPGRVEFCAEGSVVTIHGRRNDEALLARAASELQASADIQRAELSGQGSDDVSLTVVPKPLPPSEDFR